MGLFWGAACILGSFVICVDLLIRRLPGKQSFRINESGPFLASSLSLSFGVMVSPALPVPGHAVAPVTQR